MYVLYLLKCKQKTYILSLSHHFQASLHWRSKLYSRAWWGTRSGHRYHILRILHPWQDFLLSLLNVTISSCCTLPGIGRNLRRNIVEHLQLKWNKCWHVHYLKEVGRVESLCMPFILSDSNPSHKPSYCIYYLGKLPKKTRFFWEIFSKYGWVGLQIPKLLVTFTNHYFSAQKFPNVGGWGSQNPKPNPNFGWNLLNAFYRGACKTNSISRT